MTDELPVYAAGVDWTQPREGYVFQHARRCFRCPATIAMWLTPAGKLSPHDRDGTTHFATCPAADQFRRKRRG